MSTAKSKSHLEIHKPGNGLKIDYFYAAIVVTYIDASEDFYAKIIGRQPDDRPMDTLVKWRGFSNAGIQLFKDSAKAGNSMMSIVVSDVEKTGLSLKKQGIEFGKVQKGDFGKIAQLSDPDDNLITFAEPPKASTPATA